MFTVSKQWIVFFVHSDWLLKLRIAFVIYLPAFFWISRVSFALFLGKRNYLVLAIHWFGIIYTKTITGIHLTGEER